MKNQTECIVNTVVPNTEAEESSDVEEIEDFSTDSYFPKKYRILSEEAVSLENVYILQLAARFEGSTAKVLLGLSEHNCVLYDVDTQLRLHSSNDAHEDVITGVKLVDSDPHLFYTSSLDGTIKLWDMRTNGKPSLIFKDDTDIEGKRKPIACFDVCCDSKFICGGTPLVEADSYLLFWDARKSRVLGGYWEAHTDDVTQVKFHPTQPNVMLSASSDGLINIYDVSKSNEDDALDNCLNVETSIRKVEWINGVIGCITDTETVQLWKSEDVSPYADLSRNSLASQMYIKSYDNAYVADIHRGGEDEIILIGGSSVNKGEHLKCLAFNDGKLAPWATFENNKQLIRCSWYDESSQVILTAGESGIISLWSLSSDTYEKISLKDRVKKNRGSRNFTP